MEEKYIEKTLKAIRAQDYTDYEIIVADSSSSDRTVEISRKYADKVVVSKERGISLGRNLGAVNAKGEILQFLDADTEIQKGFLREIDEQFKNKKVVCVAGYIKTYGKKRNQIVYKACSEAVGVLSKTMPRVYGIAVACRRSTFDKIDGFDETLETAEDIKFGEDMSKHGKVVLARNAIAITSPRRLIGMGLSNAVIFHIKNFFRFVIFKRGAKNYSIEREG